MMVMQKHKKVKVKVTLVIDDFILMFFILHLRVIDFIILTNPLTTHNWKTLTDSVLLCTTNLSILFCSSSLSFAFQNIGGMWKDTVLAIWEKSGWIQC
jgi:hypothetical protein